MENNFALLRALACEDRARVACDIAAKKEWEALAIEWHLVATRTAKTSNTIPQVRYA